MEILRNIECQRIQPTKSYSYAPQCRSKLFKSHSEFLTELQEQADTITNQEPEFPVATEGENWQNHSKSKSEINYKDIAFECLISQDIEIAEPETIFDISSIPVFTRRSLSTIIAKPKEGKTTVAAWIAGQLIQKGLKVVYIDTEQGQYYGSRTQNWILRIAGSLRSNNLKYYNLKIYNPKDRIEIIKAIIPEERPDIIIIDGIRDLVFDINSPEEATTSTGDLMRWSEGSNCHIVNILHQNKGNEHARGHLGSELINKSETVLKVSQNASKEVVLEPEFTRGISFMSIAFARDCNGIPVLIENWTPETTSKTSTRIKGPSDVPPESHTEILANTFSVQPELIRSQLHIAAQANIKRWLNQEVLGKNKVDEWIHHWEQFNYIKVHGTRGTKAAKYSINN